MMTCRRCGQTADEMRAAEIPRVGELALCELCLDHLYVWLRLVPPLPAEPTLPEPPVSLYYED